MRPAAIYARYSTELQSDRSIDDQIALCRESAARNGLTVVRTYSDRARTSASLIGREGIMSLLDDAKAGLFEVVIVEALDRISRDQEDLAGIHKRLDFAGIEVRTAHGGKASLIEVGMQGLMGQIWLAQNKDKIRRGLAGVVRDGRNAGGRAYGYRPVPGRAGALMIDEAEAATIRRIFSEYCSGESPRMIAAGLNADKIPAPRGQRWSASTINGNWGRGHGLLANELYRGRIVWGRVRMVLDPETGKRVSRPNDRADWQWADAPHLRIVEDQLWDLVDSQRGQRAGQRGGSRGHRPLRPFSGIIRCGCCGSGMAIQQRRGASIWLRCTRASQSGDCDNRTRPRLDRIEQAVLGTLRDILGHPAYVQAYVARYHAERKALANAAQSKIPERERQAKNASAAFSRAHDLYLRGVLDGDEAIESLKALRIARDNAQAALAEAQAANQVITIHPEAAQRLSAAAGEIHKMVDSEIDSPGKRRAVETLRELVEGIVVTPDRGGHQIDVLGDLSCLAGVPRRQLLVAEEGFEPPTRGL